MFPDSIALVHSLPCLAEPGKIIVIGRPACLLDKVLIYLAAQLGVIAFNSEPITLTFRRQPGFLTLRSNRGYIMQVVGVHEGLGGAARAQGCRQRHMGASP